MPRRFACPVEALQGWLTAADIPTGALFRSIRRGGHITDQRLTAQVVRTIVKEYAEKAGFDPDQFGAHSMRSGFLTSAAARGANLFKMMDVSRHKSIDVLRGYVRAAEAFKNHAGEGLL